MPALTAMPCDGLAGHLVVPGDKSISHRALMLGAVAVGETRITGLLAADDVLRTARAVVELGAEVETAADGTFHVQGRGVGGLQAPSAVLDLGNAGTAARLLLGLLASHPLRATLTGDASLRSRPMERVAAPLRQIGAEIRARPGCRLPLTITGTVEPLPIRYRLPVASAQVKSAVLLAGLNTPGETIVEEPEPTRDHSERMLSHFGAQIAVDQVKGVREIRLAGQPELAGATITVPGDPSSAAYAAVAATVLPGSEILLEAIGVNPLRTGVFETLTDMGADIAFENHREAGGEPVADLRVRAATLHGVAVPAARAPRMIDEYPILAVAAACAEGRTEMTGLDELRVKESDRLAAIARGLAACGVKVEEGPDSLAVVGPGGRPPGGNTAPIATQLDHRIAMSFLILGLAAEKAVTVDNAEPIATSFPDFAEALASLGAAFTGGARP